MSAAVLFDLAIGDPTARPDSSMGYKACLNATDNDFERGSVGAGTGATFGKLNGIKYCTKGGIGTSCITLRNGVKVGVLVVVNAFGDVIDPQTNIILGGARDLDGKYINTYEKLKQGHALTSVFRYTNTTLGIIATNAQITKEKANRIATLSHNGLAKVISPVHTVFDGDAIFVTGRIKSKLQASVDLLGNVAAEAIILAVIDAIKSATTVAGVPCYINISNRI